MRFGIVATKCVMRASPHIKVNFTVMMSPSLVCTNIIIIIFVEIVCRCMSVIMLVVRKGYKWRATSRKMGFYLPLSV